MKDVSKWLKYAAVASIAVTLLGCQTTPDQSGSYKFELVGQPAKTDSGTTVAVRLVHTDESPVTSAQLFVVRWTQTGQKTAPMAERLIPLQADTHGDFTYTSESLHAGDKLSLAARLQPDGSLIRGSVEVH